MGSISLAEYKRIRRLYGTKAAEAANRGEPPHLVQETRRPLGVFDTDSEEIDCPVRKVPPRPIVDRTARPVADRPRPVPTETVAEIQTRETVVKPPKPTKRPILNPVQARFVCISWNVQRRLRRSPTQAELEIIRDKIFFGGNFFAAMSMLERVEAIARDDVGATVRYRILEPHIHQLGLGDTRICQMAVTGNANESAAPEEVEGGPG